MRETTKNYKRVCCWNCGTELQREVFTISEAAAFCRVSINTIYAWMNRGLIEWVYNPGGKRRIYRDSLVRQGAETAELGAVRRATRGEEA